MFYFFVVEDQADMNQMVCDFIIDICNEKKIKIMIYRFSSYSKAFYELAYASIPNKVFVCDIEITAPKGKLKHMESGLEFGKKLREKDTKSDLIYLSNYDYENEVATSIFNCTRYIKKNCKNMREILADTIDYLVFQKGEQQKIVFRISNQITYQFQLNEINYVQKIISTKYCEIHTITTPFKYYITLKELNKTYFHNHFVTVKRSYLVNSYNIRFQDNHKIIFSNGDQLLL